MRLSRYFLPILRETPKEAEIVSHRLMLRAGMMRQEAAGIYAFLPLGLRVLDKICQHRARGAEPLRRDRAADADDPVGRPVARERPLRRLRQGDAAHQGPARARHAVRPDQRGDDHRHLPRLCALLQGSAAQPLSHPVEVPRRGAAALRADARARVPDEGRLFVRRRSGRRAALLQQDVRRLSAHLRAARPEVDPDACRHRADRRRPVATSSSSWPRPARARCSATRTISTSRCRARTSISTISRACRASSTNGPRSMRRPPRSTRPDKYAALAGRQAGLGARHRGRPHLLFRHQVFRADEGGGDRAGRQPRSRCTWAPTASGRRGWSRRSSRPATTRPASSGRRRSRRSG